MAAPAKTVSKGGGKKLFKNTLDLPFKLKWPSVSTETATDILSELVKSLEGVKSLNKTKRRRARVRLDENEDDSDKHPSKKLRLSEETDTNSPSINPQSLETTGDSKAPEEQLSKHSQLVVGINEVTRALEKGSLRAVVVCLSAKPALIQEHILILSSTRNTPCVALSTVSDTVAPVLGIKRATTIGIKKECGDGTIDHFSKLTNLISERAPKIKIPWLQASTSVKNLANIKQLSSQHSTPDEAEASFRSTSSSANDNIVKNGSAKTIGINSQTSQYLPLTIKKTIITPKKRKR